MAVVDFDINMNIKIPQGESKSYGIEMYFGKSDKPVIINIQTYCWLRRKLSGFVL